MIKKWISGSHFELVPGNELRNKDIIQINENQVYENYEGYAVFLCEVADGVEDDD